MAAKSWCRTPRAAAGRWRTTAATRPPRQLLEMIPGLELVPLPESELCCGAAGSYNLTQPEMAERLGRRKAERILATGAGAVFTGNVGCLMQITRHLRAARPDFLIAHPIDALWASYRGGGVPPTDFSSAARTA